MVTGRLGLFAFAVLGVFASCCDPKPVSDPSKVVVVCASPDAAPTTTEDAAPPMLDGNEETLGGPALCAAACRNLEYLKCPESKTLEGGQSCREICEEIAHISSYSPICVMRAKTVVDVRKCPQIKCMQ